MAAVVVTTAKTQALVANTADTVTFNGGQAVCEIVNLDATSAIWIRLDGTAATVEGAECIPIPANSSFRVPATPDIAVGISVISTGTPKYCVHRVVSQ